MRLTRRKVALAIGVIGVLFFGFLAVRILHPWNQATHHEKAVYYCPMHPTYTSDRPGDCPICNMKLVRRQPQDKRTSQAKKGEGLEDICVMHNCPKLHDGRPCPMLVVAKEGESVICPICGTHVMEAATASKTKKILYWTDPMMPGFKSDKPGKSPMGMDLVPVFEETFPTAAGGEAPPGYSPLLITPQKQQLIGVKTAPVKRRQMTKIIRTVGRIAYDPELYQAQQEYLRALAALEKAKGAMTPEVNEQAQQLAEAARMRLRLLGLGQDFIEEMSEWNGPDKSLLLADENGRVWLYAPIYEFEVPLVKLDQTVTVEIQAIPGKTFEGTIRSMDSVLDPMTRSARVRAILLDPERVLRPEMFANASIRIPVGEVLAIPEEAVFDTGLKRIVFVDKGSGLFEPRDVTVGVKAEGFYELKAGVTEGEAVVTSGNFLIDSESRLKAALEGMDSGRHPHGP